MAAIYGPRVVIVNVVKISSPEEDKKNDGCGKYEVQAQVTFNEYSDTRDFEKVRREALERLKRALA